MGSGPRLRILVNSSLQMSQPRPLGAFTAAMRPCRHHSRTVYSDLLTISPTSAVEYSSFSCRTRAAAQSRRFDTIKPLGNVLELVAFHHLSRKLCPTLGALSPTAILLRQAHATPAVRAMITASALAKL